ncbi:response regulator [Hansschlegelia quercus]|uniref:Response regulator n=2 Tax=Hansschlegelia quercus TaxID=2528245 RepID=A0A4V2JDY8_9HYPH|nr:response regulator [Hansschlegelia quercus]
MDGVVLVVEDDPVLRLAAASNVREAGSRVLTAANADEALSLLESNPDVSVLFTDVDMPGSMDGVALSYLVHERWPNIKFIVVSGHASIANEDLPDDGRFVSKPYYPRVIQDALRNAVQQSAEAEDQAR